VKCRVHRIAIASPSDVSGLVGLLERRELDPGEVVAVLGKTEGNGCVNDFSRGLAAERVGAVLAGYLGQGAASPSPA
jgi:cyanuric acid amidohydrolase